MFRVLRHVVEVSLSRRDVQHRCLSPVWSSGRSCCRKDSARSDAASEWHLILQIRYRSDVEKTTHTCRSDAPRNACCSDALSNTCRSDALSNTSRSDTLSNTSSSDALSSTCRSDALSKTCRSDALSKTRRSDALSNTCR